MKRAVFSSVFEADFAEITAQLALAASPELSMQWEESVIRLIGLLQKFPHLGRIRRDLHPSGIRTFGVKEFPNFLVFYRSTATEIILIRVRYGGMDFNQAVCRRITMNSLTANSAGSPSSRRSSLLERLHAGSPTQYGHLEI